MIVPCNPKYNKLRLKNNVTKKYIYVVNMAETHVDFPFPQMLSPYVFQLEGNMVIGIEKGLNDAFFNWVNDNKFESTTTLEEIKKTYEIFCAEYDDIIPKDE